MHNALSRHNVHYSILYSINFAINQSIYLHVCFQVIDKIHIKKNGFSYISRHNNIVLNHHIQSCSKKIHWNRWIWTQNTPSFHKEHISMVYRTLFVHCTCIILWVYYIILYQRGDHSTICIQIVASKHRSIRIIMCTPKILSCTRVKKRGELQLHKR